MKTFYSIIASTILLSGCVTINYPQREELPVSYIPKQLPPIGDERCDSSCKSACEQMYMPDVIKYNDCVVYQNYSAKEWMPFRSVHF